MDSFIQRMGMFRMAQVIAIKEEQMKIKYIVEIGWREEYSFDNADAAMAFAIVCATHRIQELDADAPEVRVRIIREIDYKGVEE